MVWEKGDLLVERAPRRGGLTGNVDWDFEEDTPLTNAKKAALTGGRWVTIEGRHVYLKGGKIVAGPRSLVGEDIKDVARDGKSPAAGKAVAADTKKGTDEEPRKDAKKGADADTVPEGTFGVAKGLSWDTSARTVSDFAKNLLGSKATKEDLVSCAGVPDGASVKVEHRSVAGRDVYTVNFSAKEGGEDYGGTRTLIKNRDGSLQLRNDVIYGQGKGLEIFGRQVENATRFGFTHIEAHADGQGGGVTGQRNSKTAYNGYYTWPRMGYNAEVPAAAMKKMPADLKTSVEKASGQVAGLMATREGREWWLGHGSKLDATFDLKKGSYSRQTFRAYLEERGKL